MRVSQPIGQNDCGTLPIVFICQKRHPVVKCDACRTCRPAQICFFIWKTTSTDGRFLHIVLRQARSSRPDVLMETTFRPDLQSRAEAPGAFPCSLLRFPLVCLTTPDPRASFVRIVTRRCCAASPEILLPAARIEDDNEPHLSHTPGSIVRGRSTSAPALH